MDALEVLMCDLFDKANLLNTALKIFQVHSILAMLENTRHTAFSTYQSFPSLGS